MTSGPPPTSRKGVELTGSGSIGSRLWAAPSISGIGLDMTSVDASSNVLIPQVRAKVSMRIAPDAEATPLNSPADLEAFASSL